MCVCGGKTAKQMNVDGAGFHFKREEKGLGHVGVRRGRRMGAPRFLALPTGVGWSAEQVAQEAGQVWREDESPVLVGQVEFEVPGPR